MNLPLVKKVKLEKQRSVAEKYLIDKFNDFCKGFRVGALHPGFYEAFDMTLKKCDDYYLQYKKQDIILFSLLKDEGYFGLIPLEIFILIWDYSFIPIKDIIMDLVVYCVYISTGCVQAILLSYPGLVSKEQFLNEKKVKLPIEQHCFKFREVKCSFIHDEVLRYTDDSVHDSMAIRFISCHVDSHAFLKYFIKRNVLSGFDQAKIFCLMDISLLKIIGEYIGFGYIIDRKDTLLYIGRNKYIPSLDEKLELLGLTEIFNTQYRNDFESEEEG